jgi:hypothetical protein
MHLYTLQEIIHIKDMIFNSFNGTLTGLLYTSSMALLLLELGCSSNYQWTPFLIDQLSMASLVKETWKFLYTHQIVLQHDIILNL